MTGLLKTLLKAKHCAEYVSLQLTSQHNGMSQSFVALKVIKSCNHARPRRQLLVNKSRLRLDLTIFFLSYLFVFVECSIKVVLSILENSSTFQWAYMFHTSVSRTFQDEKNSTTLIEQSSFAAFCCRLTSIVGICYEWLLVLKGL